MIFCRMQSMLMLQITIVLSTVISYQVCHVQGNALVIGTWNFDKATTAAWNAMMDEGKGAVEAVVAGGAVCEQQQCDGSVGYGGSPDENGETTLDALIMDGKTMDVGSVANLRNVKEAIEVAYAVLRHTEHTMLVGSLATDFARAMGFQITNLSTEYSLQMYNNWKNANCQPNYWQNVTPNPRTSCGPYSPISSNLPKRGSFHNNRAQNWLKSFNEKSAEETNDNRLRFRNNEDEYNHDTLGMVAVDAEGNVAGGTTTNGMRFKIPGRVGDSPITGSGAYADNLIGGAAATGDGDIMMRFLPSFYTVEMMRLGYDAKTSAEAAVQRIARYYPSFSGAVVAATVRGDFGAACHNLPSGSFPYTVRTEAFSETQILSVTCV